MVIGRTGPERGQPLLDALQPGVDVGGQGPALLGELDAPPHPLEQRPTQDAFQLPDLLAHRRLADQQLGRSPGVAGVAGRGVEGAQQVQGRLGCQSSHNQHSSCTNELQ